MTDAPYGAGRHRRTKGRARWNESPRRLEPETDVARAAVILGCGSIRLVRGTQHTLDMLDVLHRDRLALRIHDGAFSAMDLTACHPRSGELLSTVKFMVQTLAAAGELQRDLQRELTYDGPPRPRAARAAAAPPLRPGRSPTCAPPIRTSGRSPPPTTVRAPRRHAGAATPRPLPDAGSRGGLGRDAGRRHCLDRWPDRLCSTTDHRVSGAAAAGGRAGAHAARRRDRSRPDGGAGPTNGRSEEGGSRDTAGRDSRAILSG